MKDIDKHLDTFVKMTKRANRVQRTIYVKLEKERTALEHWVEENLTFIKQYHGVIPYLTVVSEVSYPEYSDVIRVLLTEDCHRTSNPDTQIIDISFEFIENFEKYKTQWDEKIERKKNEQHQEQVAKEKAEFERLSKIYGTPS